MPLTVHVDEELDALVIEGSGVVTVQDFVESLPGLRSLPGFRARMPQLLDVGHVEETTLDAEGLGAVVQAFEGENEPLKSSRLAIVVGSDVAFGIARQYSALAHPLDIPMHVTRDRDEAIAWLREGGGG